jgi:hypothetical protein
MEMKVRISLTALLSFAVALMSGCVNLPDTKALITPVGVAGIHSFAPRQPAGPTDFRPADAASATNSAEFNTR